MRIERSSLMKSVYIHIPFCKSICSYCDFCKMFYYPKWAHDYLVKLKEEIEDAYLGEQIDTIYIGGGTPSCLREKELEYLLYLTQMFKTTPSLEFTFECNLEDINEPLLKILKRYHVNRLSIGIQSFLEQNLIILGRSHTFESAKEKMAMIRTYGFKNVNLDLIYAIPKETMKDLKKDLQLFLKLKPDHISTYSLILEPHTILARNHMKPISEDLDASMYEFICKTLKKKGFTHYEVSNFALKGKESRHNLTYWNNEEYYGFGLSASGYRENIRYTNTLSITEYLKGNRLGKSEILSMQDVMEHEMMLGLRKMEGISLKDFKEKFGVEMSDVFPITPLLKNGDLKCKKGRIYIPMEKIYVMNEILEKMI